MNERSIGFLLFRVFFGVILLGLLGMLYWSSTLVEESIKQVQVQLTTLEQDNESLRLDIKRLKQDLSTQTLAALPVAPAAGSGRPHMEGTYPNLLENDPYFQTTLPKMLGPDFQHAGVSHQGILGRPQHLHPFNNFRDVSMMNGLCNVSVAKLKFGKYETMAPDMAVKLEARPREGTPTVHDFWVHLRDDVYWRPLKPQHFPQDFQLAPHFLQKHQVTAHDFKFFYDAVMNLNISEPAAASLRNYYGDIEDFIVIDDLTFVVKWKPQIATNSQPMVKYTAKSLTGSLQPLPRFVFQHFSDGSKIIDNDEKSDTYRTNSVWAQNFSQHFAKNIIASCGPYYFDGMNDEGIKFRRNNDFFDPYAALSSELKYTFKESFDTIWQDFKAGKTDLCLLAPSQLPELDMFLKSPTYRDQKNKGLGMQQLNYIMQAYYYIGWNSVKPLFTTKKVRQALTLAIDRSRIIEQNLNGMGVAISGPFYRYSPSYDATISPWPFNPHEARRMLDEEGWIDLDGDGIRDKIIDGKRVPFRFTLVYFAKNITTKVICEYIATALKEVGVECRLNGLDLTDLSRTQDDKSFDAIYMGWALGTPPEDPRQLWYSSGAKEKGSSNVVGFANAEADHIIDTLQYEYDKKKRLELYHRFHKIIHEEAPYTFLYSPKSTLLYRDYVQNLFIPREQQAIVPGADVSEPDLRIIWLKNHD